jgi:5-formyltetrahydrofolate cyclo-ligase
VDEDAPEADGPRAAASGDGPGGKAALRAASLRRRRERAPSDLQAARAAIRAVVLAERDRHGWEVVAGYVPLRTEPGSTELLDELAAAGVRVIVPVRLADNDLDWTPWRADTSLGVDAIADVDAALVPALAVADDGTRLGRGGGSYDRALARADTAAVVAALLFDGERVAVLPRDPWDVPVRAVVTASGWESVLPSDRWQS